MEKILHNIFSSCFFFLGFIWLHTFIRLNRDIEDSGTWIYILKVFISVVATVFYYWCFIGTIIDPLELLSKINTRKCATITNVVCLVMVILLILELSTNIMSVIDEQEIRIGTLSLSKKYIFDICVAVLFPIVIEYVLKSLVNEHLLYLAEQDYITTISFPEFLYFPLVFPEIQTPNYIAWKNGTTVDIDDDIEIIKKAEEFRNKRNK